MERAERQRWCESRFEPPLATAFAPDRDQRLACAFRGPAADRQPGALPAGVANAAPVLAEVLDVTAHRDERVVAKLGDLAGEPERRRGCALDAAELGVP